MIGTLNYIKINIEEWKGTKTVKGIKERIIIFLRHLQAKKTKNFVAVIQIQRKNSSKESEPTKMD